MKPESSPVSLCILNCSFIYAGDLSSHGELNFNAGSKEITSFHLFISFSCRHHSVRTSNHNNNDIEGEPSTCFVLMTVHQHSCKAYTSD